MKKYFDKDHWNFIPSRSIAKYLPHKLDYGDYSREYKCSISNKVSPKLSSEEEFDIWGGQHACSKIRKNINLRK